MLLEFAIYTLYATPTWNPFKLALLHVLLRCFLSRRDALLRPGGRRAPLLRQKRGEKGKGKKRKEKKRKEKGKEKEKARHKETKSPSSLLSCLYRPSLTYGGGEGAPAPINEREIWEDMFFYASKVLELAFLSSSFNIVCKGFSHDFSP